jgi:hypothetical protein
MKLHPLASFHQYSNLYWTELLRRKKLHISMIKFQISTKSQCQNLKQKNQMEQATIIYPILATLGLTDLARKICPTPPAMLILFHLSTLQ